MTPTKSAFLFSVVSASSEPPVENAEFLDSFLRYGAWLRLIAANQHREVLARENSSQLQRYSSAIAFYQTLGMQSEDIVANLVAWAAWAKSPNSRLADLHKRIFLGTSDVVSFLGAEGSPFLTASYNKLKHGPQMVVANIRDVVAKRGVEADVITTMFPQGDYIRILFDGSRTQEEKEDITGGKRVAPFLLHDAEAINDQFFKKMFPAAVWMHPLARRRRATDDGVWIGGWPLGRSADRVSKFRIPQTHHEVLRNVSPHDYCCFRVASIGHLAGDADAASRRVSDFM